MSFHEYSAIMTYWFLSVHDSDCFPFVIEPWKYLHRASKIPGDVWYSWVQFSPTYSFYNNMVSILGDYKNEQLLIIGISIGKKPYYKVFFIFIKE